ncbi:MAG: DMT family transporter [Acidimicrobiia bacterium]
MAGSSPAKNHWLALAACVAVLWGLCFVLIQSSLNESTPLISAGLRSLLGGVTLAAWIARPGGPVDLPPRRGLPRLGDVIFLSVTNSTIAFGAMYMAAERATPVIASILAGAQPLMLAIAGRAIFGDRLGKVAGVGLAVGLGGVTLVAATASGLTTGVGIALALLASAAPVAGTIRMRQLLFRVDIASTAAAQFLLGGVILIVAGASVEDLSATRWSAGLVASLIVLGIAGTGLAYAVWFALLKHLSLVVLGAALLLVPVVGVAGGLVMGERLTLASSIGALVVLMGMGLVLWGTGKHRAWTRPEVKPSSAA